MGTSTEESSWLNQACVLNLLPLFLWTTSSFNSYVKVGNSQWNHTNSCFLTLIHASQLYAQQYQLKTCTIQPQNELVNFVVSRSHTHTHTHLCADFPCPFHIWGLFRLSSQSLYHLGLQIWIVKKVILCGCKERELSNVIFSTDDISAYSLESTLYSLTINFAINLVMLFKRGLGCSPRFSTYSFQARDENCKVNFRLSCF